MWLLRNLSAKKINKPFDHKGPIHSLGPQAHSFFLPPSTFARPSLSAVCSFPILDRLSCLKTSASESNRTSHDWMSQWMDSRADRPVHKDFFISLEREHDVENFLITPQNLIRDFTKPPPPPAPPIKTSVTHRVAASFPTSDHLCECFLMRATVAGVKRPSSPVTLLF